MAKKTNSKKRHEAGKRITTLSPYGSHSNMVVSPEEYGFTNLAENEVVCYDPDTKRAYVTFKNRLDNGLADPRRYYYDREEHATEVAN